MKVIKDIHDLKESLLEKANEVLNDKISLKKANTYCNVAGKYMQALRLEMEINKNDQPQ